MKCDRGPEPSKNTVVEGCKGENPVASLTESLAVKPELKAVSVTSVPRLGKGALALTLLMSATGAFAGSPEPDADRQQELRYLIKHDCGSCHGMTLQGGLGPSLVTPVLKKRGHTVESLNLIIRHGRPGTAMPPWGPLLKEEDSRWIAAKLLDQL